MRETMDNLLADSLNHLCHLCLRNVKVFGNLGDQLRPCQMQSPPFVIISLRLCLHNNTRTMTDLTRAFSTIQ